jgi:pre-mRNA branch site protein p14
MYVALLNPGSTSKRLNRTRPVLSQAKNALEHLNGFHLQERYIVVLYHMPAKQDAAAAKAELARREEELAQLKTKHDIKDED